MIDRLMRWLFDRYMRPLVDNYLDAWREAMDAERARAEAERQKRRFIGK